MPPPAMMTVRRAILLPLLCLLAACVAPQGTAGKAAVLECKRKGFSITCAMPPGWSGPVYAGGVALDSWTFSTGPAATPDTLETRIYDAADSPLRWDTASDAEILANFATTYREPRIERVATVPVAGQPTVVRAVHSVGIEEYLANVYYGDNLVSVMFTTDNVAELTRQRAAFLAFLGSLRFEKKS